MTESQESDTPNPNCASHGQADTPNPFFKDRTKSVISKIVEDAGGKTHIETLQELDKRITASYGDVFQLRRHQICPHCGQPMPKYQNEVIVK